MQQGKITNKVVKVLGVVIFLKSHLDNIREFRSKICLILRKIFKAHQKFATLSSQRPLWKGNIRDNIIDTWEKSFEIE